MKTKLTGMLTIILGVFLCAGVVAASDVTTLQPASDIIYNENVDINGSLNTDSLRVGTAGLGGVTFFNGSVLNEGATDPFTVADDMRVDGEIWRGVKGGDPIKISDNVIPTITNTNDFGSSANRWNKLYAKNADFNGDVNFNDINISGMANFNDLNVSGVTDFENINVAGGFSQGGVTINSYGQLRVGNNSIFNSNVEFKEGISVDKNVNVGTYLGVQGDIYQARNSSGAIKALVMVGSNGLCNRPWTFNNTSVTCKRKDGNPAGVYTIDFAFDINDRYWQVTPIRVSPTDISTAINGAQGIDVFVYDDNGTTIPNIDSSFMLTVY